jgi:hypothetical protein
MQAATLISSAKTLAGMAQALQHGIRQFKLPTAWDQAICMKIGHPTRKVAWADPSIGKFLWIKHKAGKTFRTWRGFNGLSETPAILRMRQRHNRDRPREQI